MFTVVIAPKRYIDSVREYEIFLKPFIDTEKMALCEWVQEGRTLAESVPALTTTVARREHWRAVVVCGDERLGEKNPFEMVHYEPPEDEPPLTAEEIAAAVPAEAETDEHYWDDPEHETPEQLAAKARQRRYLQRVLDAKRKVFKVAAEQPLTRLMTYLCEQPMISEGMNHAAKDVEFEAYQKEALCKQEIRRQIVGGEKIHIFLPEEVYCIAQRTFHEPEYDVQVSWAQHVDHQYSRFYDWNLYFDKMRYLVFDILPVGHQNYIFDYVRFLYALLLFACNQVPPGSLRANRVYQLRCDNDEEALRRLIASYDEKLHNTELALEDQIRELAATAKEQITDYEVSALFCSGVSVPVTMDKDFDQSGLFVDKQSIGLSTDCPIDEGPAWDVSFRQSEKTLYRLLKQPRRSVKRAVDNMRRMDEADVDRARLLNEFQMEDVREFVSGAEANMVATPVPDLYDLSRYKKKMAEGDRAVREKIETRMTRGTTLGLGAAVLGTSLLCFVPMLLGNQRDAGSVGLSLLLAAGAIGTLLLTGFVCLFFLRAALTERINDFNGIMEDISDEVSDAMLQSATYLGHSCNVMRGFSAINYFNEHEDKDALEIRVRKKHIEDIRSYREHLHEIFGMYFTDPAFADPQLSGAYPYNFSRPVDFDYSVPFMPGEDRQIEYLQPGNEITVPVNFVERMTVRQEELYD